MINFEYYKGCADYILEKIDFKPEVGLILGSALGSLADEIEDKVVIDYKDVPNFLISTAPSHASQFIFGKLGGKNVVCLSGRFHYYEGYEFEQLTTPIRVLKLLGVDTVILTNAAGAINENYRPGDVMIIKDHINLVGASPMRGVNVSEFGPRFFDVSDMYTKALRELTKECAEKLDISLKEGVYYYAVGPHFETPAEIRAMRILGGDTVGMSTITESLTAAHCGIKVLGLSLVTNMAAGVLEQPINTEEVDEIGKEASSKLKKLIKEVVKEI